MKAIIFLVNPDQNSFCHTIAERVENSLKKRGVEIQLYDLYKVHFDPVLTKEDLFRNDSFDELITAISARLTDSELIIFIHPDWWGQPPAMLKGLIDRVFRRGIAYDFEGGEFEKKKHVPLLTDKKAFVFCTTDSDSAEHIDLLQKVWRIGVFDFCGLTDNRVEVFTDVRNSSYVRRNSWLEQIESILSSGLRDQTPPTSLNASE